MAKEFDGAVHLRIVFFFYLFIYFYSSIGGAGCGQKSLYWDMKI